MKLYYSPRSPFARRIRTLLHRFRIQHEPCELNVFEPTREFLKANPLGLVPVLELGGDYAIADSAAIVEYLHENHGERVWPSEMESRHRVRSASTSCVGVMTLTVSLFLEKQRKHRSAEWFDDFVESIQRTLNHIEAQNLDGFPWTVRSDGALSQAGYDLVIAWEYLAIRAPELQDPGTFPKIHQFCAKHRELPELRETRPPAA